MSLQNILAVAMILVSVAHIADSLILDLFKYSLPLSFFLEKELRHCQSIQYSHTPFL